MKISVCFWGFSSAEELTAAVKMAAEQKVSAELEYLICDPENLLGEDAKAELRRAYPNVLCADASDPLGVLQATGEYIAVSAAGYVWKSADKLARQLAVFQKDPACSLVMHDVEVVKENGYPVDQSVRNRYLRQVGFEERRYGVDNLQRFDSIGFAGTCMFRNIFLNDKERELYKSSEMTPTLRIRALLMATGYGENLYDDRMVHCRRDEALYQSKYFPKYSMEDVAAKEQELVQLQQMMAHYGVDLHFGYRRLQIINGAFNAFAQKQATEAFVQEFLKVLKTADISAYLDGTASDAEIGFYRFLQDKIRKHIASKGGAVFLPLVPYLEGLEDKKWVYAIRDCKEKTLRAALLKQFEAQNPEARKIIAKDRHENNIFVKFFGKMFRKVKKIFSKIFRSGRRFILWRMRKKGYSDYMSKEWYDTVRNDFKNEKNATLKHKIWCYRRGFTPWRVKQYGIDEKTFRTLPSDRDYMYLHQMNCSYKKWIEDKMTFRLVLEPFKEHLPKYYFQILQRDDRQLIVKLSDLPEGFEPTFDELFRLLRQEGKLALKASSGTHGMGFYKMHYEDGKYYLNNEEVSEHGIRKTINSFKSFYVVTNYINMHDQIKEIYAGSVNTIRVMMMNRDGHHPQLMDAYMRIGSVKSGVTDNVAFGGVVCSINLETGEYSNGLQLKDHVYIPIENHPDTGTPLQGVIPNWEVIKEGVKNISAYMSQLEYLGFDVVCTPEGFTVLEINSHQDLHRLPYYDQRVRDFFFYKLARKERRFHIKRSYR